VLIYSGADLQLCGLAGTPFRVYGLFGIRAFRYTGFSVVGLLGIGAFGYTGFSVVTPTEVQLFSAFSTLSDFFSDFFRQTFTS
jgi:hypothetical protein